MSGMLKVVPNTGRPRSVELKEEFQPTGKASRPRHWVEINAHLVIKNWLVFCVYPGQPGDSREGIQKHLSWCSKPTEMLVGSKP